MSGKIDTTGSHTYAADRVYTLQAVINGDWQDLTDVTAQDNDDIYDVILATNISLTPGQVYAMRWVATHDRNIVSNVVNLLIAEFAGLSGEDGIGISGENGQIITGE